MKFPFPTRHLQHVGVLFRPWIRGLRPIVAMAWLSLGLGAANGQETSSPVELPTFEMKDQFGKEHRIEFPRPRPVLLLVGDRHGAEEVDRWIPVLKRHWGERADIVGIAVVRGIPRLFHSRVAESVRRSRTQPVLLDFEGTVTTPLEYVRRRPNVYVIAPGGRMEAHVVGVPDEATLGPIRKALAGLGISDGASSSGRD